MTEAESVNSTGEPLAEERHFQALVAALAPYGFTPNQAKLYLYLLGRDSTSAGEIARRLGIHRVDVYRKLRELSEFGLLSLYLGSPRRFTALDPKDAISSILQRKESELLALRNAASDLQTRLETLESSNKAQGRRAGAGGGSEHFYRFSRGRGSYFTDMKQLILNAKHEILKVTSGNGLRRAYVLGLNRDYEQARARGVSVKMIGEVNGDNLAYARRFTKVIQLRHVSDVHFRFIVVDEAVAMLSTQYDDSCMSESCESDSYFVFSDPNFANALCFLFEHLWAGAAEVPARRDTGGARGTGSLLALQPSKPTAGNIER